MVLESLVNPFRMEKTPQNMFLIGFLYCSIAILLSYWIFQAYASLIMVFLTTMAAIPLIYHVIKYEEEKDLMDYSEVILLKEHSKALSGFVYLFFGVTLAFTLWYVVLPADLITTLFDSQTATINAINGKITGMSTAETTGVFSRIFLNNMKVLIFCILFSFLYGTGAIFILVWNASVIGTAIGDFIRGKLALLTELAGFDKLSHYFQYIGIGLFKYAIHGIPEILAYFTAGLAGGIISIAVIKHDFGNKKFEHVLLDSADLLLISIVLLFIAALLEVFVTPIVF
ncbi:MAG: stage II sporulation protein M [Nanoarchaeota archaeon]